MSIIYDALKKVEKQDTGVDLKVKTETKLKPKFKTYLIYVLVVCFGFFVASIFFSLFGRSFRKKTDVLAKNKTILPAQPQPVTDTTVTPKPPSTPPVSVPAEIVEPQKEPSPAFVLNGVFFSQEEGYALINNQIVKEGDQIDGALVVKIDLSQVELDKEGSTIKLSNQNR